MMIINMILIMTMMTCIPAQAFSMVASKVGDKKFMQATLSSHLCDKLDDDVNGHDVNGGDVTGNDDNYDAANGDDVNDHDVNGDDVKDDDVFTYQVDG